MFKLDNITSTIETPEDGLVKLAPMEFRLVALLQSLKDPEGNCMIISHADAREKIGSNSRAYFDIIIKSLNKKGIPIKSWSEGLIWGEDLKVFKSDVES